MINLIKPIPLLLLSILLTEERGWTHPETGWQVLSGTHMCIFMTYNVYINNELAETDHNDAIGVFFNDQCIGWAYIQSSITIIPTIGDDGDNPQFPSDGDQIKFYIYDDSKDIILEIQSMEELPLWQLNTMPNVNELFACSYNLLIDDNAECPNSCSYDPTEDNNVDILDVIYLIDIILNCMNCNENQCGDLDGNNQVDIQDIIILNQLILDY